MRISIEGLIFWKLKIHKRKNFDDLRTRIHTHTEDLLSLRLAVNHRFCYSRRNMFWLCFVLSIPFCWRGRQLLSEFNNSATWESPRSSSYMDLTRPIKSILQWILLLQILWGWFFCCLETLTVQIMTKCVCTQDLNLTNNVMRGRTQLSTRHSEAAYTKWLLIYFTRKLNARVCLKIFSFKCFSRRKRNGN